jgi:hypothetical protein
MLVTRQELPEPTLKLGIAVLHSGLLAFCTFAKIQCSKPDPNISRG